MFLRVAPVEVDMLLDGSKLLFPKWPNFNH
jgi:hypothetical protein